MAGAQAGVFAWIELDLPVPGETFAAAAAARGLGVEVPEEGGGLVLGFGALPEGAIEAGVRELAALVAELA